MTTESLETIAQLEARIDELEWELQNAKDEVVYLSNKLEDEEQINKDYRKVLLGIKNDINNTL